MSHGLVVQKGEGGRRRSRSKELKVESEELKVGFGKNCYFCKNVILEYETDVPNFYFINDEICKELNLVFSLNDLSYYKGKEKVVEVFQASNSLFYYLRQDVLEEILDKYNVHLDFKVFAHKIDQKKSVEDGNCYKDYKRMLTYEDVRNA